MEHDPTICFCGPGPEDICDCTCQKCLEFKERRARLFKLRELEARLKKANIDPQELADLLWYHLDGDMERKVDSMVKTTIMRCLRGMRLQSEIWGMSIAEVESK